MTGSMRLAFSHEDACTNNGRLTVSASLLTWNSCWSQRSNPVTSLSWTISIATRGPPCAKPYGRQAPGFGSSQPIRRTSTQLNSSSPSSNACCDLPPKDQPRPSGGASENSSTTSPNKSAPTISEILGIPHLDRIRVYAVLMPGAMGMKMGGMHGGK